MSVEVRVEVEPASPFRLPTRGAKDGLLRVRRGVVHRLLHIEGERVLVRAAQPSARRVVLGAQAPSRAVAEEGLARMRFALGVDEDLSEFHERFRWDPLIGARIRQSPWRRPRRKPDPFHALAWAVTEQLIEYDRAAAIQRRLLRALGRWCPATGLVDLPEPGSVAALAPAQLRSWDLSEGRSLALIRVAREVATGRTDLCAPDHERAWRRLRSIPGIGAWTVEMLALEGQGRNDQIPAGDLGFLKLVGRLRTGNPRAVATEEEVRELFAPYHPWSGLAGSYAL